MVAGFRVLRSLHCQHTHNQADKLDDRSTRNPATMPTSTNALLALADAAFICEKRTVNAAASLVSVPSLTHSCTSSTSGDGEAATTARHSTVAAPLASIRPRPLPVSSRPAKKRPVPAELTMQLASDFDGGIKKTKTVDGADSPEATPSSPVVNHLTSKRKSSKSSKPTEKKPKHNSRRKHLTPTPSFPAMLMGILATPENSEYITFLEDERRFVILDSAKFESKVLPIIHLPERYSLHWNNFTKMLEEWDFKAEKDDEYPGKEVYSHPMFRKGDWEGCLKITKPGSSGDLKTEDSKTSHLFKPLSILPHLPADKNFPQLSQLNKSTEASRNLCNKHGLLKDSSTLQAMLFEAQAQKKDAATLQAMMLQASSSDSSTLQAMMQRESPLHAMIAAQQVRNRMISAVVESAAPRTISPESNMFGKNQASLDVMTEQFIRQSVERMMKMQVMRSQLSNGMYWEG